MTRILWYRRDRVNKRSWLIFEHNGRLLFLSFSLYLQGRSLPKEVQIRVNYYTRTLCKNPKWKAECDQSTRENLKEIKRTAVRLPEQLEQRLQAQIALDNL